MAMLLFHVGETRFAIGCSDIVQVVPNVLLTKAPFPSLSLAGLLIRAGKQVPIIDFCQLIEQRPAQQFLDSRIILLAIYEGGQEKWMGILVEKVHQMIDLKPEQFTKQDYFLEQCPFISKGYLDEQGMIFTVDLEVFSRFLSAEIFHEPVA